MKYVELNFKRGIQLKECPQLKCGSDEVIIRMKICGICGSDLQNIEGNSSKPTNKLGHEVVGVISKMGSKIENLAIGDRVFVHHHSPCEECYYCMHSNQTMCEKFVDRLEPCGMSEEFIVPRWNIKHDSIVKIPNNISFEEASLIEPLSCCIRTWKKISFAKNDSLVVIGTGAIGIIHAMLGKLYGMKHIFCIDLNEFRLKFCKDNGIAESINYHDEELNEKIFLKTNQIGADIVIIATSNITVLDTALKLVRKGGTIVLFGQPKNNAHVKIDFNNFYSKEISLIPSYASTKKEIREAVKLIENELDIKKLITKKISFHQAVEELKNIKFDKNSIKTIITKN